MTNSLNQRLQLTLDNRIKKSSLRTLDNIPPSNLIIDFSSNDYLSFSKSIILNQSFQSNLINSNHSSFGPSSSRLLDGNTLLHLTLESNLTSFFDGQSALLFNSGFDANLSIWSTIAAKDDYILFDEFLHASFHDGIKFSKSKLSNQIKFKHSDLFDFKFQLYKSFNQDENLRNGKSNLFIGIESLYSMNGDLSPIQEILSIIKPLNQYDNVHLIIDEAHSTGLYGQFGNGLLLSLNLHDQALIRLYTFGKSAACSGAVVITSSLIRNYLINYSRPLIYSSTLPHMNLIAIQTVLDHFHSDHHHKAVLQLKKLSNYLKTQLENLIITTKSIPNIISIQPPTTKTINQTNSSKALNQSFSPIFPIYTNQPIQLSNYLLKNYQIRVRPIRFPTVPLGNELIRICLNSNLNFNQIDLLILALKDWLNQTSNQNQILNQIQLKLEFKSKL